MLCPEVWCFDAPKTYVNLQEHKSPEKLFSRINENCYYHSVFVCPDTFTLPRELLSNLEEDNIYYVLADCPVTEFIRREFIANFVKSGRCALLSINRKSEIENCLAITSSGLLLLSLTEEFYQTLGIIGSKKGHLGKYRNSISAMPKIKQPPLLEELALKGLGEWIAMKAEQWMEPFTALSQRDADNAKELLAEGVGMVKLLLLYNLPWMLFDRLSVQVFQRVHELLEKTKQSVGFRVSMAKFVNKMNVAVTMTEVLQNKYLTKITMDTIPKMIRSVFYVKLHTMTGLAYLDLGSLSGGWKTTDMEPGIIYALKHLHKLKYLAINYDCTDNILRVISQQCPLLEGLDVSCSKSITNESINVINEIKNLKYVQLYRTCVSLEGYAKLLTNSRQLTDIGRCDEIGRVLEYIHITNYSAAPFLLEKYVSRYAPNEHLRLAVEMCPFVKNVTVFHTSLQNDLTTVIGWPYLTELKLLSCDFYADQIKQVLQVKGCNISSLHLEHVEQIDLNALMYISQMCPILETFTIYNCVLILHTSLYTRKLPILPYRNLKSLTCACEFTQDHQILFLLQNCLNVKYIHLGTAVHLSDDIMDKVLDVNPLVHLEELRIMHSESLSMTTVDRLLNTCLSLKTLVELECWQLLSDVDREIVRQTIKINNMDVDTTPVKRYETVNNN